MNPQTRKVWIFICLLLHQPHTQRVLSLEQSDTADGTGIVFNRVKAVILAEQYEYASFLLPYPAFQSNVSDELRHAADIVTEYRNAIPGDCPAFQDRAVKDTQAPELLNFTQNIHDQAQHELQSLKDDLQALLQQPPQPARQKKFVGMILAATVGASIMALGTQLMTGCVAGVLGPACPNQRQVQANRQHIQEAVYNLARHQRKWSALTANLDEKFFIVAGEIQNLRTAQREIEQRQMQMWNATNTILNTLTSHVQTMQICEEYLYTRSQINVLRTALTSKLHIIITALQSFRTALWSYRATILDAIPGLAKGMLPMSLVPRTVLLDILERINNGQARHQGHLTLALPLDDILRYYETPLAQRAETTEDGLLLTIAIPLTSREMIMEIFEGIPLPMPSGDNHTATVWVPETQYLAVSTDRKENALLSPRHLDNCVGPNDAAVCQHGFATTRNRDSCLATSFFHTPEAAMSTCRINTVDLPRVEQAQSLGYGRWLITRHTADFNFHLLTTQSGGPKESTNLVPGCCACVLTLACGMEHMSDNLYLKADASSCNATGTQRLDLHLSAPLADLFSYIPVENSSTLQQAIEARTRIFKEEQAQLPLPQESMRPLSKSRIQELLKPLVSTATQESTWTRRYSRYTRHPWKCHTP